MKKMDKLNQENALGAHTDEAFLNELLAPLWRARKMIAVTTVAAVVLGLAAGEYLVQYKSEGFFQFGGPIPLQSDKMADDKSVSPGIMLADYKRYAAVFSTRGRFDDFVQQNKLEGEPGLDRLRKRFSSNEGISKAVEPIYPFTKLDAKELMEQPKDASNNVIGLHINYDGGTPESAQRMTSLLGRYAMDSIVYVIYSDVLRFKHAEISAKLTKLDNDIIDSKEKLAEYRRRGAYMQQIVARHPESAAVQASRQVVNVTEDNARYLSPTTHLMAIEVVTANVTETIEHYKREQRQDLLLREYYDYTKKLLDSMKSGEAILRALEPAKEKVFKGKDLNDELVKEIYNTITIDNQRAINLYLEKSRFIAGPTLSDSRTTRISLVLIMSLMAGLLISSSLVFLGEWTSKPRRTSPR